MFARKCWELQTSMIKRLGRLSLPPTLSVIFFKSSIWQKAYPKAFSNLLSHFNGPWCDWWSLVTATPPKWQMGWDLWSTTEESANVESWSFSHCESPKKHTKSLNGTHTHMHYFPWICQFPFCHFGQVFCGKLPPIFQSLESQYEISLNIWNSPMTGTSNEHE